MRLRGGLATIVLVAIGSLGCGQRPEDPQRLATRRSTAPGAEEPIEWEEGWADTDWDLQLAPCDREEVLEVGDEFLIFDSPTYKGLVSLRVRVCASDSALVQSKVQDLQGVFVQTFRESFQGKGALCSLSIRKGAPAALRREWTERYRDGMLRALNDAVPSADHPRIRAYECEQRYLDYR